MGRERGKKEKPGSIWVEREERRSNQEACRYREGKD